MDEAGRGPWAGPVVAAAVILPARRLRVRIDDSKRLTPRQRLQAFRVILKHAEVGFGIVCAAEIDRRNILQASLLAMCDAVGDLPAPPDLVLADGPYAPPLTIPCRPVIHGDQRHRAIAAASIMAKVLRDHLMTCYHRVLPDYGFHRHKGYGTPLHARQLQRFGPSPLHRMSFAPVAASHAPVDELVEPRGYVHVTI